MCASPCLRVERIQLTSRGRGSSLTMTDVVFLNKPMLRRNVPTHPRAFLLALTRLAPSHALLIAGAPMAPRRSPSQHTSTSSSQGERCPPCP